MIRLRYLSYGRIVYTGEARYVWEANGAEQEVDIATAAVLLLKRQRAGGCCGGTRDDAGPLFEEVGDYTDVTADHT